MRAQKNITRSLSKSGPAHLAAVFLFAASFLSRAATFTNNASIQVNDPTSSLTCTGTTFTVSCWFRISLPSSQTVSDNMDILMDRTDGNESANFSYLIRYNYTNNAIEFVTHGASSSPPPYVLIQSPFLERWYHVAISRSGSVINCYVDGRPVLPGESAPIGSTTGSGITVGGINGSSKQFYGDIIEVAYYSAALSQSIIQSRMFQDQRTFPNLNGYYKFTYSTNSSDFYHNFVPSPPSGTDPAARNGSGQIGFDQVDQAGEQSIFDANRNHGEGALTPLSGAFAWQQTAFARPVPGIAFDFEYGYSTALPIQAPADGSSDPYDIRALGPRWRNSFDTRVVVNNFNLNEFDLITWDGAVQTWTRTNLFAPFSNRDKEYRGELVQLSTSEVQWTTPQRLVYVFGDPTDGTAMAGKLERISDFNSNVVQILWNQDSAVITNVIDTVDGAYRFNYDQTKSLLTNVTFGQWQVNFGYDTTNRLTSKTLTNTSGLYTSINATWQFRYDTNGLLSQIIDPRGNTNIFVQYDQYGRQTNQVDAIGRATRAEYNTPNLWQMRRTDAGNFQWIETYDHKGHLLAQQDSLTNITSYAYDTNGNRTSITEPLGWTTYFGYDNRANVIAKTNALAQITLWVIHPFFNKAIQQITPQPPDLNGWTTWTNFYRYDAHGNLTNQYDALGSLVTYTYFTNGLVLTSADADGHTTQFGYDVNGFLKTRADAATNTTTYFMNDAGWKMREVNPLSEPTSYAYDLNGNVARIQDALSRVFYRTNDPNGNLLASTDGKGLATTYQYDAANQRTNMTDRTGTNTWKYFYTVRGKLDHVTDPLNNSVTNTYDADNHLIAVTDPLGHSVTNQYDANGNLRFFFDNLGRRWSKTYDRLNRLQTDSDPLGNTKRTIYDVAGRVQEADSPNGYPSLNTYDGRGRLIKWVDPMNFPWLYAYDGVGNITNIEDALHGHYLMTYGSRNERLTERNQDNFLWQYTYDKLLRLKTQTDPNLIVRTRTYDAGGRLKIVDFQPTGREDTFDYDDNDNMRMLSRSDSSGIATTLLIPDLLDRIQEEDEPNGQTVLYGHDALGRVTSLTYPGGKTLTNFFDPLNRLTNQVDWAGRQTTYSYDLADRLRSRTYPNGVVQTNNFDDAGRITGLEYSSSAVSTNAIKIALSYAYDRNGNKTGGGESGTFNWPQPALTDERVGFTVGGRLINRQITETSPSNSVNTIAYHYDPSGNMTNADGNGQSWSLTYDEDNRTTSIQWDWGMADVGITNRYDALGRRFSKTVDGNTIGYVLDLSSGMERVLCDLDGNGNPTAWYVHGPALCYKVDATNGLTCYHADAMGNVIALTDGKTNLVAQYAYTPYGRCQGSTNFVAITNPYLFVGSQGVMNEFPDLAGMPLDPNLYFMRARYYSADAGVFLSTDSIKKIGPGWKPSVYSYGSDNPSSMTDPRGLEVTDSLSSNFKDFALDTVKEYGIEATKAIGRGFLYAAKFDPSIPGLEGGTLGNLKEEFGGWNVVNGLRDAGASYLIGKGLDSIEGKGHSPIGGGFLPAGFSTAYDVLFRWHYAGEEIDASADAYSGDGELTMRNSLTPLGNASVSPNSMANRTVAVAAPKAAVTSAATSKLPSGAIGGGGTPSTSSGSGSTSYTVKPGDTLGNIGYANGSTASAIGAANGIQNLNLIYPGQVLTIPRR
jgi:RHS repeat-associated protein